MPGDTTQKPGPGAHSPERVRPALSFVVMLKIVYEISYASIHAVVICN